MFYLPYTTPLLGSPRSDLVQGPNRINRGVGPRIHCPQSRRQKSSFPSFRESGPRACPLLLPAHHTINTFFFRFVGRSKTIFAPNTATWTFADPLYHKTCISEAELPTLSAMSSMTKVQSHHWNPPPLFLLSLIQFLQISSRSKPPFSKDRVRKVPENSLCKLASVLVTITLSSTLCNNHRSSPSSY